MRIYDIIAKKRANKSLDAKEINFILEGFVNNQIPDYQMSALLMAICLNGMSKKEIYNFTVSVINSGEIMNLEEIEGIKVDKHSTGGVGDKTTLIVSSIVACLGVPIAKMSGRGLGYTGGTIDKLESIPGFRTSFSKNEFINLVKNTGVCISSQSNDIVPADKKIYALRDLTATVDSIPLIASSIMSKKIACGSDRILLDVKIGNGAFMKKFEDGLELATTMVEIGEEYNKKTTALITDMNVPLGCAIGNNLEIIEVVDTLNGKGPKDLEYISLALATEMLYMAEKGNFLECKEMAIKTLKSKEAFYKLIDIVKNQDGDYDYIFDTSAFESAKIIQEIRSKEFGYISKMDVENIGNISVMLGAGRENKDSVIDHSAGIVLKKKTGDYVKKGDILAVLYTNKKNIIDSAERRFIACLEFSVTRPIIENLIYAKIDKNGVIKY